MEFADGFAAGAGIGLFAGGFLAYKYADKLVAKAVAEFRKAEAAANAGYVKLGQVAGTIKKEL